MVLLIAGVATLGISAIVYFRPEWFTNHLAHLFGGDKRRK